MQTRTPEQIAALVERFYGAVCKMPGETMVVLAKRLGVASKELKLPAERLRRAGRVRGVGQKSHLKYFPMVSETNAREEVTA